MIVLTHRETLVKRLKRAMEVRWGAGKTRPIHVFANPHEAAKYLQTGSKLERSQFVVIDLGVALHDLAGVLHELHTLPWLGVIAVMNATGNLLTQTETHHEIMRQLPHTLLLVDRNLEDQLFWTRAFQDRGVQTFGKEIREELLQAVRDTGHALPAEERVLQILDLAPSSLRVADLCTALQISRHRLCKELQTVQQLEPRDVLTLCRLLYTTKLYSLKWTHEKTAKYMGLPNAHEHKRRTFRRLHVPIAKWATVPYADLVHHVAQCLVHCGCTDEEGPRAAHRKRLRDVFREIGLNVCTGIAVGMILACPYLSMFPELQAYHVARRRGYPARVQCDLRPVFT